jgi:uncharacterized protein
MRRIRMPIAMVVIVALTTIGLVASPAAAGNEKSVKVDAMFFRGGDPPSGGSNSATIRMRTGGSEFRVGFTEDEVAGTGDQWRAAGWSAATVATLITGSPLTGVEITYDVEGIIDGPSAGALLTGGVLSLLRGDKIKKNVIMTGTINPDGTVGPVGGIPYKIQGAIDKKKTVMLIPDGQRNSLDFDGNLIDMVDLGNESGIDVVEVADIYEAYEQFTGKELPRLSAGGDTELSPKAYDQLENLTQGWLAEADSSANSFSALDPTFQEAVSQYILLASEAYDAANAFSAEGVQAGAYNKALEAAAFANAASKVGSAVQIYFTQGAEAFFAQINSSAAITGKIEAFFDSLRNYRPKTLSEASGLIGAYGSAIDALSLSDYAGNLLAAGDQAATAEEAITLYIVGAVLLEIAGTSVDAAKELQNFSSNLAGPKITDATKVSDIAKFFRRAAEANLEAFDTVIIQSEATAAGASEDQVRNFFADNDTGYLLALSGSNVISEELGDLIGNAKSGAYANLGGAVALYSRSAVLIEKYYALGAEFADGTLEVVGLQHEGALTTALELADAQAAGVISVLRDKKTDPALIVGAFEIATADREGTVLDKLDALSGFYEAFIGGRVLSYLGGFETAGLN